jgi:hypothetical protein
MARRDGVIAGLRPEWTVGSLRWAVDGCSDELFLVVDGRLEIGFRGLHVVRSEDEVRRAPARSVRCGSCDGENSNSGKTAPGVADMISSRRRRASARSLVRSDLAMRPAV